MHAWEFLFYYDIYIKSYISSKVIILNIHASFNQTFSLKYFEKKFRNNVRGII